MLECDAVQFGRDVMTFSQNHLPPSWASMLLS